MKYELIYDVMVGGVFVFDNAVFVMCPFDFNANAYPSICIATKKDKYEVGEMFFLDDEQECILFPQEKVEKKFMKNLVTIELE